MRLVADLIRGKEVDKALAFLSLLKKKLPEDLEKLLAERHCQLAG
jgi:ribosomal protein L22